MSLTKLLAKTGHKSFPEPFLGASWDVNWYPSGIFLNQLWLDLKLSFSSSLFALVSQGYHQNYFKAFLKSVCNIYLYSQSIVHIDKMVSKNLVLMYRNCLFDAQCCIKFVCIYLLFDFTNDVNQLIRINKTKKFKKHPIDK